MWVNIFTYILYLQWNCVLLTKGLFVTYQKDLLIRVNYLTLWETMWTMTVLFYYDFVTKTIMTEIIQQFGTLCCEVCPTQCALRWCVFCTMQWAVCNVQWKVCSEQCVLCTVQCLCLCFCAVCIVHCAVGSVHCVVCGVQCTVCNVQWAPPAVCAVCL